ncbi:MAG TPA: SOS response-associated peptidase [Natronosporangium sp.]
MCGRYATTRSAQDLSSLFDAVDETEEPVTPRYNVAPTDPVPVVRTSRSAGTRVLSTGRWGLLPHWARDRKQAARMINARAETVATAPAFAPSFASRRALVPIDGWYEWRRLTGGGKQAYFMTPADGSVLALAGLWSRWGAEGLLTFTIVTTAALGELTTVHDRMPLVLPPERWQEWLTADAPSLAPPPPELLASLELRPVGPAVGNVRNDGPELVMKVDPEPASAEAPPTLF